jgi:hypothetical protein
VLSPYHFAGIAATNPSPAPPVYVASDIKPKRRRRTKAAINSIRDTVKAILEESSPQTVQQVYYALTVKGAIAKTETEYQRTTVRLLTDMREAGELPFEWIADNSRWMRKPASFTGIERCLSSCAASYRRDLWAAMPTYVEVWCEKDALAGVIMEETKVYDVPLMVAKGYSSITFLHTAAKAIEAKGKPTYIYHFGDLDPSGVDAARDIETKLRRYAPGAEIHFERPAVTREQVERWNLPTRPTKQTDTRAKRFANAPRSSWTPSPPTGCARSCANASSGTSISTSSQSCALRRRASASCWRSGPEPTGAGNENENANPRNPRIPARPRMS